VRYSGLGGLALLRVALGLCDCLWRERAAGCGGGGKTAEEEEEASGSGKGSGEGMVGAAEVRGLAADVD
jgi:hypothetical protein